MTHFKTCADLSDRFRVVAGRRGRRGRRRDVDDGDGDGGDDDDEMV